MEATKWSLGEAELRLLIIWISENSSSAELGNPVQAPKKCAKRVNLKGL